MHAHDGSSERLGEAVNVLLHICMAIRSWSVLATNPGTGDTTLLYIR